ncbi:cupin domain-containing protein [Altererythrobacter aquiaggeris]|uniref:cupin domain-containing protein n=1 Tax=Aestuarierythrobacter aquiaggeris TaxID=1898396 RepID=UPI00301B3C5E
MIEPAPPLANFDTDRFLREYWQKKPLLIRQAFPAWDNPLAPDELAGLACEDTAESRLITQNGDGWKLEHGAFTEDRLQRLDRQGWTLLVQAVDHFVPEVAALLEQFRFIPNWRIDDVMVSLAPDGGGVGPHFDQYDVFLLQGLGSRRWQIGGPCDDASKLIPHGDLRLLADFRPLDEWVLEPGDMLYVPPGIAHNGVAASDDCMTYSIGFRAPSVADLIGSWADDLLDTIEDDERYRDGAMAGQANPGEITPEAVNRLHSLITSRLCDREAFAAWFGGYNTAPKYPDVDWQPYGQLTPDGLGAMLAGGARILRNPASRFAYIRGGQGGVTLFVDGTGYECSDQTAPFAERLCAGLTCQPNSDEAQSPAVRKLAALLHNGGSIAFEEDA